MGILDGKGFKIKNLKINTTKDYTALFAYGNGSTVQNLVFEDLDILSNSSFIGAIFGGSSYSNIINCHLVSQSSEGNKIGCKSENYTSSKKKKILYFKIF